MIVALPIFYMVARAIGAHVYRRTLMPAISVGIFVLGAIWLIERALQVNIIGM